MDKCGGIDTNVKCLRYREVEALECFELLVVRYGESNAVTPRIKIKVLQSCRMQSGNLTLFEHLHKFQSTL